MPEQMHYEQRINACANIIQYDARAFGNFFQLAHRRRLQNVESTEKYKTQKQRFPIQWDGDETDELAGDFVDDNESRIFEPARARNLG